MDMNEVFNTFYQECDVKKEIEECSIMLTDDKPDIRVIKDETIEQIIQHLMLKSFVKGSESTLEMMKKIIKFDNKSVEL
jgi:hypothetical protein